MCCVFSLRFANLILFLLSVLWFLPCRACGEGKLCKDALEKLLERRVTVSPSRLFTIESSNSLANVDLSRWAEGTADKIEKCVGLDISTGRDREFRIIAGGGPEESVPPARVLRRSLGRRLVFALLIRDYHGADVSMVQRKFCSMILQNFVAERCPGHEAAELATALDRLRCPGWLINGLWLDLKSEKHASMNDSVLRKWEQGLVPGVGGFLRSPELWSSKENRDLVWCFFSWVRTLSHRSRVFDKLFDRVASGRKISRKWIANELGSGVDEQKLERDWDVFLLRRRGVILKPGRSGLGALRELEGMLLLYRGNSGIPLSSGITHMSGFGELIDMKDEPWIATFAKSKSIELKVSAAGRGKHFRDTVDSYCRFLEALRRGKDREKLVEFLRNAKSKLQGFREQVRRRMNQ